MITWEVTWWGSGGLRKARTTSGLYEVLTLPSYAFPDCTNDLPNQWNLISITRVGA